MIDRSVNKDLLEKIRLRFPGNREKQKSIFKCYRCGYISEQSLPYCPDCQREDLNIHLLPFVDR